MIQERPTALRILQTSKKKDVWPALYLLIGFFAGILFSLCLFLVFFQQASPDESEMVQTNEPVVPLTPATKEQLPSSHTPEVHHQANTEIVEDSNFAQPQSSELTKFFQHTAKPAAAPEHRVSPFANEPGVQAVQPANPKVNPQKTTQPAASHPSVKPVSALPAKAIIPVPVETEAAAPQASVQIKVTQKPFAVNELQ